MSQNQTVKLSNTEVIAKILSIVSCVGLAGIAIYAFYNGNPTKLTHPINSKGEGPQVVEQLVQELNSK